MINFFGNKHLNVVQFRWRTILFICCTIIFFSSCKVAQNYNPNKNYPKQQLQKDYTLLRNILQQNHPALYWYTTKDSIDYYFDKYP